MIQVAIRAARTARKPRSASAALQRPRRFNGPLGINRLKGGLQPKEDMESADGYTVDVAPEPFRELKTQFPSALGPRRLGTHQQTLSLPASHPLIRAKA